MKHDTDHSVSHKARNMRVTILLFILFGVMGIVFLVYNQGSAGSTAEQPTQFTTVATTTDTESEQSPIQTTTISIPTSTPSQPLLPPPPAPPLLIITPTGPYTNQFGMSVAETLLNLNATDLNNHLNDIASLGVGWIRFDMQWNHIQPSQGHSYNWNAIDRVVAAVNTHHMHILAILDYTPAWDRPAGCPPNDAACLPADPSDFDNFVKAAVTRYSSQGVSDWEIWNEPNLAGSMEPDENVTDYVSLLQSAYVSIKEIQPSATVVTGGLAPAATMNGNVSPLDFLSQMYADGAQGYFDAVGFHPYTDPALPLYNEPWNAWSQMSLTDPSLRSIMIENGDAGKQIWLTEYGAPTGGPGLLEASASDTTFAGSPDHETEALQAQMIGQAITAVQTYPWAGPLFIYSYKDIGTSTSTIQNFFGVIRYDGSTKPAYYMIKSLLE